MIPLELSREYWYWLRKLQLSVVVVLECCSAMYDVRTWSGDGHWQHNRVTVPVGLAPPCCLTVLCAVQSSAAFNHWSYCYYCALPYHAKPRNRLPSTPTEPLVLWFEYKRRSESLYFAMINYNFIMIFTW